MGMGKAALSTCGTLGVEAWVVVAVGVLVDTWGGMCMRCWVVVMRCNAMLCAVLNGRDGVEESVGVCKEWSLQIIKQSAVGCDARR